MPFPNEHAAIVKPPRGYVRFSREKDKFGEGIDAILGVKSDGKEEPQTIRFKKSRFTVDQAQTWLKEHDYADVDFQPASGNGRTDGVEHQIRWDRATLHKKPTRTPDGFLKADATVTRTGVFSYRNVDGSIRRELRHPDDVLDGVSLDSMKLMPVTLGHPPERIVTSETAKFYQVGATGENVRPDGQFILCPVVVTDGDAIAEIERGRNQVSLGYGVDLIPEKGKFRGEPYDFRQTNIRYNHLAIVDSARTGEDVMIHLDAADAVLEGTIERESEPQSQEENMGKFNIDGCVYEAPQEVINYAQRHKDRADKAEGDLKTKTTELETVTGERDAHKAKLDEAEKVDKGKEIRDGVTARRELERKAEKALKGDESVKVDELDDKALMVATVKKVHADADLEGKSDEYIQARFDSVCEAVTDTDDAAADTRVKAGGDQHTHEDGKNPVGDARSRMIDRMTNTDKKDKDGKGGDGK